MGINIYQVDVFSSKPFGGNPAGVVPDARGLSEEDMQDIAREMNLSETVFIVPKDKDNYEVRFFTPTNEVDLCGHGTIGAFYVLACKGYIPSLYSRVRRVYQNTKVGKLAVDISYCNGNVEKVMMEQAPPKDLGKVEYMEELLECFNIERSNIGIGREYIEPRIVSTGLKDILLPLNSKETLESLRVDFKKLEDISNKLNIIGVHAFYLPHINSDKVYTRNFAPAVGINEESATGTANGGLIYFLKDRGYIHGNEILSIQGEQLNRKSLIYCRIHDKNGEYSVKVGGQAKIVLEGIIYC